MSGNSSEDIVENEQEAIDAIEEIKAMRLTTNTKRGYESKMRLFGAWLEESYPYMVDDKQIVLDQLTIEAFQEFIVKKQGEEGLSFSACSVPRPSLLS